MAQFPIGLAPLKGRVGSLIAAPGGNVPAGKTVPFRMNRSPRFGPPTNVRQSAARSKLRTLLPAACTAVWAESRGVKRSARPLRRTNPNPNGTMFAILFILPLLNVQNASIDKQQLTRGTPESHEMAMKNFVKIMK
jgi:hypothetical protein